MRVVGGAWAWARQAGGVRGSAARGEAGRQRSFVPSADPSLGRRRRVGGDGCIAANMLARHAAVGSTASASPRGCLLAKDAPGRPPSATLGNVGMDGWATAVAPTLSGAVQAALPTLFMQPLLILKKL